MAAAALFPARSGDGMCSGPRLTHRSTLEPSSTLAPCAGPLPGDDAGVVAVCPHLVDDRSQAASLPGRRRPRSRVKPDQSRDLRPGGKDERIHRPGAGRRGREDGGQERPSATGGGGAHGRWRRLARRAHVPRRGVGRARERVGGAPPWRRAAAPRRRAEWRRAAAAAAGRGGRRRVAGDGDGGGRCRARRPAQRAARRRTPPRSGSGRPAACSAPSSRRPRTLRARPGASERGLGGAADTCCMATARSLSPVKGRRPVSISKSTTPRL